MLVLLEHHFGGFNHGSDGIAHFQFHLFRTAAGDYAFDQVVSDTNENVGHDAAQLHFFDLAYKMIARRKFHAAMIYPRGMCAELREVARGKKFG